MFMLSSEAKKFSLVFPKGKGLLRRRGLLAKTLRSFRVVPLLGPIEEPKAGKSLFQERGDRGPRE